MGSRREEILMGMTISITSMKYSLLHMYIYWLHELLFVNRNTKYHKYLLPSVAVLSGSCNRYFCWKKKYQTLVLQAKENFFSNQEVIALHDCFYWQMTVINAMPVLLNILEVGASFIHLCLWSIILRSSLVSSRLRMRRNYNWFQQVLTLIPSHKELSCFQKVKVA